MKAGLAMDAYKKTEEIINANTELEAEKEKRSTQRNLYVLRKLLHVKYRQG